MEILRGALKRWTVHPPKYRVTKGEVEVVEEAKVVLLVEIPVVASVTDLLTKISVDDEAVDFGLAPVQRKLALTAIAEELAADLDRLSDGATITVEGPSG